MARAGTRLGQECERWCTRTCGTAVYTSPSSSSALDAADRELARRACPPRPRDRVWAVEYKRRQTGEVLFRQRTLRGKRRPRQVYPLPSQSPNAQHQSHWVPLSAGAPTPVHKPASKLHHVRAMFSSLCLPVASALSDPLSLVLTRLPFSSTLSSLPSSPALPSPHTVCRG